MKCKNVIASGAKQSLNFLVLLDCRVAYRLLAMKKRFNEEHDVHAGAAATKMTASAVWIAETVVDQIRFSVCRLFRPTTYKPMVYPTPQ